MIVSENIDRAIIRFRHEVRKSGIVSQLKLREIPKKSLRKKAKAAIAERRRRQAEKRRRVYTEGKR
ncbi:MAG: 30S ribosomal protein S21 [Thermodesulfobacteriota bacterium]|jgi:ribosomal protein S21